VSGTGPGIGIGTAAGIRYGIASGIDSGIISGIGIGISYEWAYEPLSSTLAICCWRAGVDGDGRFVVGANYVSPVTPQKQSEHHGVIWQSGMGSGAR